MHAQIEQTHYSNLQTQNFVSYMKWVVVTQNFFMLVFLFSIIIYDMYNYSIFDPGPANQL